METIENKKKKILMDWSSVEISKFLLRISYIGANYYGIAYQKNDELPTIEGEIYKSLLKLNLIKDKESCDLVRCGRTDRGVHSRGNYISVNLRVRSNKLEPYNYMEMLNGVLPWDIRITGYCPVRQNFNARFDCSYRIYKYYFPLNTRKFGCSEFPFISIENLELMNRSAKQFIGTHDFRRFCKMDLKNRKNQTYTRTIYDFDIQILKKNGMLFNQYGVATIKGSAFLWHQVRLMMGVIFEIGQLKMSPDIISDMLKNINDKNLGKYSFKMASEIGLILWDCIFDEYNIPHVQTSLESFLEESRSLEFKSSLYNFIGS